jgi:hypothetical protein
VSTADRTSDALDFIHDSRGNSVEINRGSAIKDVEDLDKRLTELLGDLAFFRVEFRSRFVLGGEVGGSLYKSDGRLNAVKNLAVFVCRK